MSHFLDSLHPDDAPPHTQGDDLILDEPVDEPEEGEQARADDALTTWLGGRQPVLEPVDALLPAQRRGDAEYF